MIKGYKVVVNDLRPMKGKNIRFEIGKWYTEEGDLVLRKKGFHFCKNITDLADYCMVYSPNTRIFEVEADGKMIDDKGQTVAEKIRLVREINKEEWDTKEMRMVAVQSNGLNLRFFPDADSEIQLAAIRNRKKAINFVKNPSREVQEEIDKMLRE